MLSMSCRNRRIHRDEQQKLGKVTVHLTSGREIEKNSANKLTTDLIM